MIVEALRNVTYLCFLVRGVNLFESKYKPSTQDVSVPRPVRCIHDGSYATRLQSFHFAPLRRFKVLTHRAGVRRIDDPDREDNYVTQFIIPVEFPVFIDVLFVCIQFVVLLCDWGEG